MPSHFGALLRRRIEARMTCTAFAAAAGISHSFLSSILTGRYPLPLKRVDRFIAVLGSPPEDRQWLRLAALASTCPPEIQVELRRWRPDLVGRQVTKRRRRQPQSLANPTAR